MLGALALTGCDDEISPGSLTVTWRTAGLSCADGAITEVQARLFTYDSSDPVAEGMVDCASGRLTLDDLRPGGYSLMLQGFQDGCWTHGARREDIAIRSGAESTAANLPLDRRPRDLVLRWPFAEGGTCVDQDIEQVEVEVVVRGSVTRVVPTLCQPGELLIPGVAPGPLYLSLLGYDANGTPIMSGEKAFSESAFEGMCEGDVEIEVQLSVCDGPTC